MGLPIVEIKNLSYAYKTREALSDVSFSVESGEIFGMLGPNGSGKTTLFRILSTFFSPEKGQVRIDGLDLASDYMEIRKKIGVVFQYPSLDPKLTVEENLRHQGHLYGLSGGNLRARIGEMLGRFDLRDRTGEIVQRLSGGLKRRVELAKGLLHRPVLLILDEPSTGLDPGARLDLWNFIKLLREKEGVTSMITTHLVEEAENCDRLAILNKGQLVTIGAPENLKRTIGADVLVVKSKQASNLARDIEKKFGAKVLVTNGSLQIEHEQGHQFITKLVETFPGTIDAVTFRKPTLEDVFMHETGHKLWEENS